MTKTTQGTADGDTNVVARILAWQYAEDIEKLARTQDAYSVVLILATIDMNEI